MTLSIFADLIAVSDYILIFFNLCVSSEEFTIELKCQF